MVDNKKTKAIELLVSKYRIALKQLDWALDQLNKKPEVVVDWYENTDKINFLQDQFDQLKEKYNKALDIIDQQDKQIKSSSRVQLSADDADNHTGPVTRATDANFGTGFPPNPKKGDLFLRVDMLPHKLFKWNGTKWIEVAKTLSDRYAYEGEYVKYLVEKILRGEYNIEDLSKAEQEEVLKRLNAEQKNRIFG